MQYTLTLTPRMLTIAGICFLLLCVLLFLLGVEIGKNFSGKNSMPTAHLPAPVTAIQQEVEASVSAVPVKP